VLLEITQNFVRYLTKEEVPGYEVHKVPKNSCLLFVVFRSVAASNHLRSVGSEWVRPESVWPEPPGSESIWPESLGSESVRSESESTYSESAGIQTEGHRSRWQSRSR